MSPAPSLFPGPPPPPDRLRKSTIKKRESVGQFLPANETGQEEFDEFEGIDEEEEEGEATDGLFCVSDEETEEPSAAQYAPGTPAPAPQAAAPAEEDDGCVFIPPSLPTALMCGCVWVYVVRLVVCV